MPRPRPARRPAGAAAPGLAALLAVALPGCDRPTAAAPPPDVGAGPVRSASVGAVDTPDPPLRLPGPADRAPLVDPWGDPGALPPLLDHPEGVPFPLPDPLPPASHPRDVVGAPRPAAGPAPLAFWLGGTGVEDGRLSYPRAIVAEAGGGVVVVDKTGRLQRFDADGVLRRLVHTPAIAQGKPTGLGLGPGGELLVADTHYARVLVYGPDLALRRVFGAPGRAAGGFMFVSAAKLGPDGLLWTVDYGDEVARAQAWSADAEARPLRAFGAFGPGPGELRRPMSLAFGPGEVYLADAVNHRIAVFAPDGRWLRALGGPGGGPGELDFPYDVVTDEAGRLWVCEFGNQRLQVLDPRDGRCLGLWGEPGRALGALARPWGVALGPGALGPDGGAAGRVWVLDSQNDRVYALERATVLAGAPR